MWLRYVTHFKLGADPSISQEWLKLELSNFVPWFARIWITNCPLNGHGLGHVTSLNFQK